VGALSQQRHSSGLHTRYFGIVEDNQVTVTTICSMLMMNDMIRRHTQANE
jgi:hypothetical protein